MADRSRKTRFLRAVLLVAVQVIATFLLLEVALRLIRPHHTGLNNLLYLPSVSTNFSRVDNTADLVKMAPKGFNPGGTHRGFVLNSRGLRTHEYADERSGGLRIVALGDSFTWGAVPYRDTWPFRLQSILRKTLSRQDVEVISLGVPGAGPKFYLRMWELEGRRLQPDLVVLGFFIGNDLTDHSRLRPETTRNGWLVEHSLAVRAMRNLARVVMSGVQADPGNGGDKKARPGSSGRLGYELPGYAAGFDPSRNTMSEAAFMRIEWNRMASCLESNRPMLRRLLRRVGPVLEELDRSVADAGAELVVFLIPDEFQVNDELSGRLLETNDTDPTEFARYIPQNQLVKFLEEAGIRHIDGLRRFRSRSTAEDLYLPRNTHWNAAGNRLAAHMMVDYFQTSGLLPVPEDGSRP
jgi:hypothetical protein